jgi:hypothetical protein
MKKNPTKEEDDGLLLVNVLGAAQRNHTGANVYDME